MSNRGRADSIHDAVDKIMAILDGEKAGRPTDGGGPSQRGEAGPGVGTWVAERLGIPPKLAVAGGKRAYAAMMALLHARDAGDGGLRQQHLAQAQRHIAALDPGRHGQLLQHLQGCVVALGGRGGDTKVAHVTPGEVVIPERLQTPELLAALHAAARAQGIDPSHLVVGNYNNSINPDTGQPEFQDVPGGPLRRPMWGPPPVQKGPFPEWEPTSPLKGILGSWVGDTSGFNKLTPEQLSGMTEDELAERARATGTLQDFETAGQVIGPGLKKLLPDKARQVLRKIPSVGQYFETPMEHNEPLLREEFRRRKLIYPEG